ncbi:MAG TPA: hypothetical protein VMV99_12005 [Rhodanobacter sp.]|nr:hypothetical protein [Rhodanobacter sp.]
MSERSSEPGRPLRARHAGPCRAMFAPMLWLVTLALLLVAAVQPVPAQIAPRLTGEVAIKELDAASAALAARAAGQPGTALDAASRHLKALAASLRQSLGGDVGKPVETVGSGPRARVLRAHAAALRTQDFLKSCSGCTGADASATAAALAAGIDAFATDVQVAKWVPVIDTVETLDHRPLFAIRQGGKASGLALNGVNLADTQCADPRITATDAGGKPLATQPTLTGVLATRLELRWPGVATLPAGPVVLHVVPQHKMFLLGCTTLPEATATFEVTPPVRFAVAYELSASCASGQTVLGRGTMPTIEGYRSTVVRTIDTSGCAAPQSYTVTATVALGGGSGPVSVGPITQSADAAITAGLPGGLILSWNPAVKTLFVRSGASQCKGVD